MKKTKAISVLLVASMAMSMTGCSGAKKKVIEAADEYAKAILSADAGDIADLMKDDDEAEAVLENFFDRYSSSEDLNDVYEFILENTTYKIDKKSVEVKDKKASATIVFTMIDYMDVYDELDDDSADAEDFMDALEEGKENTCEVELDVEFKLVKDDWKIIDKDNEGLLEFYEFYTEIAELGLAGVPYISSSTFEDKIMNSIGIDSDDISRYEGSYYDVSYYYSDDYQFMYYEYDDADDAQDIFEDAYEELLDEIDGGDMTGSYYYDGTSGYVVFDGECYGVYMHGGFFIRDNILIEVYTNDDGSNEVTTIDSFLNSIGFPGP